MGVGYVRQSSANILTGNVIEASDLNAEYNAIENAMNGSTGHSHDGTTGEGPKIDLTTSVTGVLPIANGGTGFSALGSISTKTTPIDADSAVIVDSADSNNPKRLTFSNLWTWAQSKAASPGFTSIVTSGNTTIGGTLGVTGATTLSSTLGVTSNTTIGGTLGVTGNTTIGGTLGVTGATTLAGLSATTISSSGNSTIGGTLGVTGVATFNNNATVGGTLQVTGSTSLSSTLAVTGNTTVGGTLGVTSGATLSSTLDVTGATTLSGNATVGGTLGVTGAATFSNNALVSGTFQALGSTSLGSTLGVTGAATLSSTLAVTGTATLAAVNASGNVTVGGTLDVTGATTMAAVAASSLTLTTPLAVAQGGTGSTTAAAARTALFGVSTTTDNTIARYDGTTGAIQSSGVVITDANVVQSAGLVSSGDILPDGDGTRDLGSSSVRFAEAHVDTTLTDLLRGATTAGSLPVQGEGSATVNLQQSLAKSWCVIAYTAGVPAFIDSYNSTSLSDNGTGDCSVAFTNWMSNTTYVVNATNRASSTSFGVFANPVNTGSYQTVTTNSLLAAQDDNRAMAIFGDLA